MKFNQLPPPNPLACPCGNPSSNIRRQYHRFEKRGRALPLVATLIAFIFAAAIVWGSGNSSVQAFGRINAADSVASSAAVALHPYAATSIESHRAAALNNPDVPHAIIVNSKLTSISKDGLCTLNEAVINANNDAQTHADCEPGVGKDVIRFEIAGPGPHMLHLKRSNKIKITGPLFIDGLSQHISGMSPGSCGPNRNLLVGLTGIHAEDISGITILDASDVQIRGLVINGFKGSGIHIIRSRDIHISCVHIGTDFDGTTAFPNRISGIQLSQDSEFVTIGTNSDGRDDEAEFNVISGNGAAGIMLSQSHNNVVAGNRIGTTLDGLAPLPNSGHGIMIMSGSQHNRIGSFGDAVGSDLERNIISGNKKHGITISDVNTDNNTISGNYIGTNVFGSRELPNQVAGINVTRGASGTKIGGRTDEHRNIVSGNESRGIWVHSSTREFINGAETTHTIIQNNFIGLDIHGQPLGNKNQGVLIELAADVQLMDNAIAGNVRRGVYIRGAEAMLVNNRIFNNQLSGIEVTYHPGRTTSLLDELLSQDDTISSVRFLGNLIYGNCSKGRQCAGILGIDDSIAPSDSSKGKVLARANIIRTNHGHPDIAQYWHTLVQPDVDDESVQAEYTLRSTVDNKAYTLAPNTLSDGKRIDRQLFGPAGFTFSNLTSWHLLKDFSITESGTHVEHTYTLNKGTPVPFDAQLIDNAQIVSPQFEANGLRSNVHIGYTRTNNYFSLLRYKVLTLEPGSEEAGSE